MRLTTGGVPDKHWKEPTVGRVSWEPIDYGNRSKTILISETVPRDPCELDGYRGFLTTAKLKSYSAPVPTISSIQELKHLRTGDIVAMEPENGFVRTLYRPDSDHNVVFATQRCNSNCLMCSQPPRDRRRHKPAPCSRELKDHRNTAGFPTQNLGVELLPSLRYMTATQRFGRSSACVSTL